MVTITGTLKHPNSQGDGVRSRVVSNRSSVAGEWTVHNSQQETRVDRLEVRQGDTLERRDQALQLAVGGLVFSVLLVGLIGYGVWWMRASNSSFEG